MPSRSLKGHEQNSFIPLQKIISKEVSSQLFEIVQNSTYSDLLKIDKNKQILLKREDFKVHSVFPRRFLVLQCVKVRNEGTLSHKTCYETFLVCSPLFTMQNQLA